jgi:hypothetical protein
MPDPNPPPGTTIEATVGAPFSVSLEGASGGGYRWQAEVPPQLDPAGHHDTPGPGIGGPAVEVFEFLPSSPGTATLRFVLKRPWESSPLRVVEYPVKISGS